MQEPVAFSCATRHPFLVPPPPTRGPMPTNPGVAPSRPTPQARPGALSSPATPGTRGAAPAGRSPGGASAAAQARRSDPGVARSFEAGWDSLTDPGATAGARDDAQLRMTREMRDVLRDVIRTTVRTAVRDALDEAFAPFLRTQQAIDERLQRLELTVRSSQPGRTAAASAGGSRAGPEPAVAPPPSALFESATRPLPHAASAPATETWDAAVAGELTATPPRTMLDSSSLSSPDLPGALNGSRRRRNAVLLLVAVLVLVLGGVLLTTILSQVQ